MAKYPKEFILRHGHVTTDDLKTKYGYNHPPRAARDVRERGIPLETFRVMGPDGRKIAAYRFADYPERYTHVAMKQVRRLDLTWQGDDVVKYEKMKSDALRLGKSLPDFVKEVLAKTLRK